MQETTPVAKADIFLLKCTLVLASETTLSQIYRC